MSIRDRLDYIRKTMPEMVKLIAVSKTISPQVIMSAYEAGQRLFGENKAQEIKDKQPLLPADIRWHFIGHLQTNKVKYIASFIDTIHSVDSLKLLQEIERQAGKCDRTIKCLLQFHIAREETKFGLNLDEGRELLASPVVQQLQNASINGVMGMASLTEDEDMIRQEFIVLRNIYLELKNQYFLRDSSFCEISMGMTNDYKIAIEEGSTMVRLGTAIFQ